MALNSGPYALTLNTAQLVPNPTASSSVAATTAQIQNASPFTLEIQTNGTQIIIQQFTAQTITLDGSGSPLTILPIAGPAGTQGGLTVVWLNPGQSPDMADGQLTGAAQYAQGLGSEVYSGNVTVTNGNTTTVPVSVPPTTRTLIVVAPNSALNAKYSLAYIAGATSGLSYWGDSFNGGAKPYLGASNALNTVQVAQVSGVLDPIINVAFSSIGGGVAGTFPVQVYADTASYPESDFYTGTMQVVGAGTGVAGAGDNFLNGPCRLIGLELANATNTQATINLTGNTTSETLLSNSGTPTTSSLAWSNATGPIVPLGQLLQLWFAAGGAGTAYASAIYAYP